MAIKVKICGLKTRDAVEATQGADYIGFVFFPPSPRNISPKQATELSKYSNALKVAVTVNASDALLEEIIAELNPDYLQLHGDENIEAIAEIKAKFKKPIIKAFKIRDAKDLEDIEYYQELADILLFDAKTDSGEHGGTGKSFDWNLLADKNFARPFFISGGINQNNFADALGISGTNMLDLSSSLESSLGVKDPIMIKEFLAKIK